MSENVLKCTPEETKACCCADVGTIIDNSELSVDFSQVYENETIAQEALAYLTEKARKAETESCDIRSEIKEVNGNYRLNATFTFSCQAETLIFQLSIR
ncbi:YfcZ/YiiS family protein [Histophilus somni]|uniref:YfcZ/YiiS family protein n=1 Tax=Histophilus somni TaxID=731 RepID=UPI00201F322D|nr:YfcZ/YiiS family protein [Histophilus somni]